MLATVDLIKSSDWCKYGDIGTASYEATTSSTIDAVKTACNGNTGMSIFIFLGKMKELFCE